MSGRTPSPSSSQHYYHQNQNPSASKNPSQLRQSTIQCTACGCLNFSNEATCEPCRQKTATATSQSGGSSSSPAAAAAATTGTSSTSSAAATDKSSLSTVNQPVSRTAILRKQPPPRTGIVTGLQTGLPIEAYRSGSRRTSPLGAKISHDGEPPASSSSQPLMRSNSSSSELELRTAATTSSTSGNSSSTSAAAQPARGIDLYQRVLDQQRQGHEAKRKADADSSNSSADVDEKCSIAQFFGANNGSATTSSLASRVSALDRPRRSETRAHGRSRDVIDLISSSEEDEGNDDDNGGGDANLVGGDESTDAQGSKTTDEEPRAQQPALISTAKSSAKPLADASALVPASASTSQSLTNASAVAPAQPPREAARTLNAATASPPAASEATHPTQKMPAQEAVIVYEEDYDEAPFRSRCFPSIQFDPSDFPTAESAVGLKLSAKRRSTGGVIDASADSSQSSDVAEPPVRRAPVAAAPPVTHAPVPPAVSAPALVRPVATTPAPRPVVTTSAVTPAVVPPVLRLQAKKPTEPVVSKPTPAPVPVVTRRGEPPRPVQTPAITSAVASTSVPDVVMSEPVQPVDASVASASALASATASVHSPRLKRTLSGNCQEQAIELGDDDEGFREEQTFSTRGELFQSRIFQSIEFNASDFSTIHDGLHVARRTKISALNEISEQQQQPRIAEPPVQERPASTAPTPPSNSQSRAPAPRPSTSVPVPATIPATSSSGPAPVETSSLNNPQGQPVAPGRPVNVVPMSPKESAIWRAPPKAPASSVVAAQSAPPPQGLPGGAQRIPVPQPAAAQPVASTSIATPVISQPPVLAPAASKPFTAPPVVVRPTTATPAAFQQPGYSFGLRPTIPTPVVSRPAAPSAGSTPVTPMASTPPVASKPTAATPVFSRPTTAPTPVSSRPPTSTSVVPTPTASQPAASKPVSPAPVPASTSLLFTSTSRSMEAPRSTTTAPAIPDKPAAVATNSAAATTILLARKKFSRPAPPPVVSSSGPVIVAKDVRSTTAVPATTSADNKQVTKKEVKPYHVAVKPPRVFKPPTLGACSADFMGFMEDFIDGDDDEVMNDEEETRKLHMQLLEVVDLTSLTDTDDDDDDSSSDGHEFAEPPTPRTAASLALQPRGMLSGGRLGFTLSLQPQQSTPTFNLNVPTSFFASGAAPTSQVTTAGGAIMAPKIARLRPPRQMEPCVICEKRWVRSMIHCKECGKYYHKKCAKEYGDEKICWNCELDGMIDDSDLTETHRDEIVGMLSTLRPATSSSEDADDDDGEEEDEDEDMDGATATDPEALRSRGGEEGKKESDNDDESREDANAVAWNRNNAQFPGATTKSMQRWKTFLDVSTSTVEKSFQDATRAITEDLQSDERKAKYSKGFTTPEIFQAAISEVLDSYADLQDQLDREAREKARSGPSTGSSGGETQETSGGIAAAVATSASGETSNAVSPARAILDLSGGDHHPTVVQTSQMSRVVEISDGAQLVIGVGCKGAKGDT